VGSRAHHRHSAAAFPVPGIFTQRFRGPTIRVRNIEGVREHVEDGKLRLRLKDFSHPGAGQ